MILFMFFVTLCIVMTLQYIFFVYLRWFEQNKIHDAMGKKFMQRNCKTYRYLKDSGTFYFRAAYFVILTAFLIYNALSFFEVAK